MEFALAKNEKVINRYPYVKTMKTVSHKENGEIKKEQVVLNEQELVITNKRLIIAKRDGDVTTRVEKDINNIHEVTTKFMFNKKSVEADKEKAKKMIRNGIIFCCLLIGVVLLFGILMIKKGKEILKAPTLHNKLCSVKVTFYGVNENTELFNVAASAEQRETKTITVKTKGHYKTPEVEVASFQVQLNAEVARKLSESIGADLIEAKGN